MMEPRAKYQHFPSLSTTCLFLGVAGLFRELNLKYMMMVPVDAVFSCERRLLYMYKSDVFENMLVKFIGTTCICQQLI